MAPPPQAHHPYTQDEDKLSLIPPWGFLLGDTTPGLSCDPGGLCSDPEGGGSLSTGRGPLANPEARGAGRPPQRAFLFSSELSGPGANLAGAHGLLIFSIPGC